MTSILKRAVKRSVPERWRLLRYAIYERVRYYPQLVFSLGSRLECPAVGAFDASGPPGLTPRCSWRSR